VRHRHAVGIRRQGGGPVRLLRQAYLQQCNYSTQATKHTFYWRDYNNPGRWYHYSTLAKFTHELGYQSHYLGDWDTPQAPTDNAGWGLAERMSTEDSNDPFYGNSPEDIWDGGYDAALLGRSRDTNPFRTGEAALLDRLAKESSQHEDPPYAIVEGKVTQVTREELEEIRRRRDEMLEQGLTHQEIAETLMPRDTPEEPPPPTP
jgi:hypothetical protein